MSYNGIFNWIDWKLFGNFVRNFADSKKKLTREIQFNLSIVRFPMGILNVCITAQIELYIDQF
jgi:hypothetical protein